MGPVDGSLGTTLTDLAVRVGPVLIFLVAITVVAEIADAAGVFDVAGHWAARAGHGRTWLLWLLVVVLSCVSTIFLSLDTTAVLLTPVVIAVARQLRLNPLPFAMTTVWLANTASLLLPVSNLTNLLALHRFSALGLDYRGYISLAPWPAMAAIGATVIVLGIIHLRDLRGRYLTEAPPAPHDRTLLIVAASVCTALGPAFVSGVAPAIPASVAALVLVGTLLVRNRPLLRTVKVPWFIVLGVSALFVVVDLALGHGLRELLAGWVGTGNDPADLLRIGAVGAGAANAVNNLPAYLALESVNDTDPLRLMALLIGVNVGPLGHHLGLAGHDPVEGALPPGRDHRLDVAIRLAGRAVRDRRDHRRDPGARPRLTNTDARPGLTKQPLTLARTTELHTHLKTAARSLPRTAQTPEAHNRSGVRRERARSPRSGRGRPRGQPRPEERHP